MKYSLDKHGPVKVVWHKWVNYFNRFKLMYLVETSTGRQILTEKKNLTLLNKG